MVKPYRIRPFHFLSTFLHARFQSKRMIDFLFSSEDLPLSQDDYLARAPHFILQASIIPFLLASSHALAFPKSPTWRS